MAWLNWPTRITVARIFLVGPLVICLLNLGGESSATRHFALVLFVLSAVSDALDGFLARRLREETPLGRFLDPVADKLLVTCAVILLALPGMGVPGFVLPNWVPVIAIGKDLLTVIGFGLVRMATGQVLIRPRVFGKACTLLQLVMVAGVLIGPDLPATIARLVPLLWWLASAAAIVAVIDYIRLGFRFVGEFRPDGQASAGSGPERHADRHPGE